jgi:hypothetical protein
MSKYPSPNIKSSKTLKEFLDLELSELLPNQDTMIKNHLNLVAYLEMESPLFVLRKFKLHSNRGSVYSFENHSFTVSDNEPALWVFMETYYQSNLDFLNLIQNQRFPIAFAIKKEEKQGNVWETKGRKHKDFSANGWKHCHIFQCSPLGESIEHKNDLKRRSLRLLSPLNHFPFFSPRKYAMPFYYGENKECIEYVIWWLYNHFYTDANKTYFKAFVEGQNFIIPLEEPKDIKIDYSIKNERKSVTKISKKIKVVKVIPISKYQEKTSKTTLTTNTIEEHFETNYFKIAKNWYGQNKVITVMFTVGNYAGRIYQYNHDEVYKNTIWHYKNLPCWEKDGYFSNSNNIPNIAKLFVTEII